MRDRLLGDDSLEENASAPMMALEAWNRSSTLAKLLIAGAALRLLAAWGSPGYLMHDDHFLVIEAAASWADGEDYNLWLPWNQIEAGLDPEAHPANFFYVGSQFVMISLLKAVGITVPADIALVLRLLHALWSLLIIYYTYKIAERLGGAKAALWSGAMATGWAWMPLLSVHQLVEMVCIPPLLFATWSLVRSERSEWNWSHLLAAGLGLGIATGIRFQCGLFGVGWAIALALPHRSNGKWTKWNYSQLNESIKLGFISLSVFSLTQIQDVFIWGEPFFQLRAYFGYNTTHALNYPQGPWHQYLWTLMGLATPPLAFALLFGLTKKPNQLAHWRWLAWGALAFFLFHSGYSNKQERFILPLVPFIAVLGSIGWLTWKDQSGWWSRHKNLERGLVYWSIGFNLLLAIGLCFVFSKKSRVEAMQVLYERGDLKNFAVVEADGGTMPPRFYSGKWSPYYVFHADADAEGERRTLCKLASEREFPNYLLFYGEAHLGEAVAAYKEVFPGMTFVAHVQPGRFDRFIAWLNPINQVERVAIYSIAEERCCE